MAVDGGFEVGDVLYHRGGAHAGRVVEMSGDRVYLVQDNAVEVDFPAAELSRVPPARVECAVALRRRARPDRLHLRPEAP